MKRAALFTLFICAVFSCAQVKKIHHEPRTSAIPSLRITNDTTLGSLKMSSLAIDVVVAANIATTTFDIIFYNPSDRILEGEFEFPLADGQNVTRYALDINGKLREGVVVEKAKARVAFENTIRRNIDPGLVEKTKGNNFRTRIYPIPAAGYKRVVIAMEEVIQQSGKDLFYQLPLYAKETIDTFSLKTTVVKSAEKPVFEQNELVNFRFNKWNSGYLATHSEKNFIANKTVSFLIPGTGGNEDIVLTENHDGQNYFYVHSAVEPKYKSITKPSSLGIFWDISGSADKRNKEKEIEVLKKYLYEFDAIKVSLIPFNIVAQKQEDFTVSNGEAAALIDRIKSLEYDGGTQFGSIDFNKYNFEQILLFSDGLSTFGKQEMIFSSTPVITINSSPSADFSALKYIAGQTHGKFVDLNSLETKTAIDEMISQSLQVINVSYDKGVVEELIVQNGPVMNTGLSFSGKLISDEAEITVKLGFGNEVMMQKKFTVSKKKETEFEQVKRIWATMKIAELDMQYEKNKEAITDLGKQFSVVTQNTSLIVLDRLEDYVQYEITPPQEMQAEYFAIINNNRQNKQSQTNDAFNEALYAMERLKEWWKKDYSKNWRKPVAKDEAMLFERVEIGATFQNGNAVAVDSTARSLNFSTLNNSSSNYVMPGDEMEVTAGVGAFSDAAPPRLGIPMEDAKKADIDVYEWKPDVAYLKEIEKASAKEWKSKYFSLKKTYSDQPSFFIDIARFFLEKNDKPFAIQVLSNVAEMKLESAELLRSMASQLMEINEISLAVETFNQIFKMREEDPQSYRDLALAYNESGDFNKAIDLLYQLVLGTWDGRFGDVKAIALNELNSIISMNGGKADVSFIDKRFIYAMPVDVRIVVGWSSDNSDIDLWVTDPHREKCSYSHTETGIGGRISRDVTQGYGPEEFSLKKAINGDYVVEVNLYGDTRQTLGGPITIKAEMFTDFGKPTQKRKMINFRVTSNKEVVKIGALKFGS